MAKRAWSWLSERDWTVASMSALQPYFDLLADDVVLKVEGPGETVVFGSELRGKQALIDMYTEAREQIEGNCLERPLEFFCNEDRVVVLGAERYTIKKTGVTARNKEFAIVIDFRDGLIVRIHQIGDQTEWVDAFPPSEQPASPERAF